jgi:thiamine-phosphate pyrophosphorylase
MKNILDTDLYCITGEEYSLGRGNILTVKMMLDAGIKIIQYREKNKAALEKLKECEEIRKLTLSYNSVFIVNDDIEIAMLTDADGVHIGQNDLPVQAVRKLIGAKIIGVSTHSPSDAQKAVSDGADYIGAGPVYATRTKKDVCAAVGLDYVSYVARNIKIPFVAIGGIKENNILEVSAAGARCFAMITEICGAPDIEAKIKSIREKLKCRAV